MPIHRRRFVCAAVFAACAAALGYHAGNHGLATSYVDPVAKLQAQDEAVYAASSIRMATRGDWLTPYFLGRYVLYKPPLLYWASAMSAKIAGVSETALRAPSVLAGAIAASVLFGCVWRRGSLAGAILAVLLLLADRLFHTLSRLATTDALLLLWTTLAVALLLRDPALRRRRSAWLFGAATGLAIMTKAAAGSLPLIVLVIYFVLAARADRPRPARLLEAGLCAAAVALPWHLYQLAVHPRWFWNEYILTEHLALGLSAPQTSVEAHAPFYLRRLWLTDPVLCIAALCALPVLFRRWDTETRVVTAWMAGVSLTLAGFQYRAAWYLLPLIAVLAFAAGRLIPFPRAAAVLAAIALLVKIALPEATFGIPYSAESIIPPAQMLESYCASGNPAPLFLVNATDQFYAADLALPPVHYVYTAAGGIGPHGAMDFQYLGIVVTDEQFRRLDALRPVFRERLREWGLDSGEPIATVILAPGGFTPPARDDSPAPNPRPNRGWCGSPRR